MAVDKSTSRAHKQHIAVYDVTYPDQLELLVTILEEEAHRIVAVHLAPACGTASRARERKLRKLQKKGFRIPQPLRSATQPTGLDGLSGLDKLKTELANLSYDATGQIVQKCLDSGIVVSVENPTNSLFWLYPCIQHIVRKRGHVTNFDNCMHGGRRAKSTQWWSSHEIYMCLTATCNDQHKHASWAPKRSGSRLVFPSAEEAAYPFLLCKRVAHILLDYAKSMGAVQPVDLTTQLDTAAGTSHRWILGMLPRGKKFKPLVSEFQGYTTFLNPPDHDPEASAYFQDCPKGARVVHRQLAWGYWRVDDSQGGHPVWHCQDGQSDERKLDWLHPKIPSDKECQAEYCTVGMPREPWDFVEQAVKAGHPRAISVHLSEPVVDMLEKNFKSEAWELIKIRASFLRKWTRRCRELEGCEAKLHKDMAPHLLQVLSGKRLMVFKEILEDLNYPDTNLIKDIQGGFELTGWLPKSNVFPASTKRPSQSLNSAMKVAKGLNKSIVKQMSSQKDQELCREVWALTEDELAHGWVWKDPDCEPANHLLAKRFGLRQGQKTRLIDDCSVGGLNSTCGSKEKLRVHSIDELAAYLAWCLTHLAPDRLDNLVGKTYDLKSAYKQYGISSAARSALRIAVWNPVLDRVEYLGCNALPFGAVASVSSFLRISLAIWYIGIVGLKLCWTCFFDDYTLVSDSATSRSAALAAETLFDLLGVAYAKDGNKAVGFGKQVKTLGVVLNLSPDLRDAEVGRFVTLGHTESRVEELSAAIEAVISKQKMNSKESEKLRGRLQWFESFASGRVAQRALRAVSNLSSSTRTSSDLSAREVAALKFLKERVLTAPPVKIHTLSLDTWIVFTDGACEGDLVKEGSIGGVLVSPSGFAGHFFSGVVPSPILDRFLSISNHPIFELEVLPIMCAMMMWGSFFAGRHAVFTQTTRRAVEHSSGEQLFQSMGNR